MAFKERQEQYPVYLLCSLDVLNKEPSMLYVGILVVLPETSINACPLKDL